MKKILCVVAIIAGAVAVAMVIKKKRSQKAEEMPVEPILADEKLDAYVKNDEVSVSEFVDKLKEYGYIAGEKIEEAVKVATMQDSVHTADRIGYGRPYAISDKEYEEGIEDEKGPYDKIILYYYSDGVLTDDRNEIVDNADELVGDSFAGYFGKFDTDTVWIRNDERRCDYEILRDLRTYEEVDANRPHLRWVNDEQLE